MPIISRIYHSSGNLAPDLLAKEGPIVDIEVAVPNILRDYMTKNKLEVPEAVKGKGLIDTGAAVSCIDDSVAIKLNVKPTGMVKGHGMSGESNRNLYSAQIAIVTGPQRWAYESTRIMGVDIQKQGLIALIGRDFLRNGMMIYSGFSGIVDLGI